jgi:hypothetical protein
MFSHLEGPMATQFRASEGGGSAIQAELFARISQIERDFRLLSISEIGRRTDAIRQIARAHGFGPASHLAGSLGEALARDGRAAMIRPYLDGMREAVSCDPADAHAGDAILASVSVRLAG